jgi:hypothetical protein
VNGKLRPCRSGFNRVLAAQSPSADRVARRRRDVVERLDHWAAEVGFDPSAIGDASLDFVDLSVALLGRS